MSKEFLNAVLMSKQIVCFIREMETIKKEPSEKF